MSAAVIETPIFESVAHEQQWSPERLRPRFDIDAVIATSYDATKRRELVRLHAALQRVAQRQRDARGRFTRSQ